MDRGSKCRSQQQGRVIGPTLFLIFIKNSIQGLKSKIDLLADDAKLYSEVERTK